MSDGEVGSGLCGHRLGRLGDLSERVRDQLLLGWLPVPPGQGFPAVEPRHRPESGQVLRPALGHSRTVLRSRNPSPPHAPLHGPVQPRAPQELSRHEGVDLRVQIIATFNVFFRYIIVYIYICFFYLEAE